MERSKQWVALSLVGCLAVLAAGWFLLVSPQRARAEELRTQATVQDGTNATLRTKLARLQEQAEALPEQQARLAEVAAKVPDSPGLPSLVRALHRVSDEAGVQLVSIAPGTPAPVVAPAAGAPADPAAAPAPAPAPAAAATPGGLSRIPLALSVVGGYFELQQFLDGLEDLPRALRVTNLSLAPGAALAGPAATETDDVRPLSATVTGEVYLVPAAPGAAGAAGAPAAPVPPAGAPAAAAPATDVTPG